jgi:hypothetical protein
VSAVPATDAATYLREAAREMHHDATDASPEDADRWRKTKSQTLGTCLVTNHDETPSVCIETYAKQYDRVNDHVAAWDPTVAHAVADFLEEIAEMWEKRGWGATGSEPLPFDNKVLAIARAYCRDVVPCGEA